MISILWFTYLVSSPPLVRGMSFFFVFFLSWKYSVLFPFTDPPSPCLEACKPRASPSQAIIESFPSQPWFASCMSLALSLTILYFGSTVLHACLSACWKAVWGFRHERCSDRWRAVSAIYVSLRCATPHYSFHTASSLPQPTYETSHISTCTTCHRTCTTSVASDAPFCSWIERPCPFLTGYPFCQGLDLRGLLPHTGTYWHLPAIALQQYQTQCTRQSTQAPDASTKILLIGHPTPVRLRLALQWPAHIPIHGNPSSSLEYFFSNRLTSNHEHGYRHCRFKPQ